jgi:hypothetical protein
MDQLRILVRYSLSETTLAFQQTAVGTWAASLKRLSLLGLAQTCLVVLGAFMANASGQSAPAKTQVPCPETCIHVRSIPGGSGGYKVEVEIENRSKKSVRVAGGGFLLFSPDDPAHRHEEPLYFAEVNLELGIPAPPPAANGAIPESSTILAPHDFIRWQFNLAELRWASAGRKPIRYGNWNSIVQEGPYILRAGVTADSREIKSEPISISKTTSPSPVGSVH